jgi:cytochrome bd ubiquinol oxidase subunit I
MDPHALLLARIQFGFTISVHIIFPAFSIGSSAFVATLLVLWRRTGSDHYHRIARFWTKIFAVSFAMGVVSGVPLSYELGTNWSRYSLATGNIIGPLIGYEVLAAFFLESTFLGIMLFGWTRVPPWLHVTSAVLVALGTMISGFWILAANSWTQTPAGHIVQNGIAIPVDWFHVIFNPSFPYRFTHMMTAAYLTTSVVVLAAGARYLLEGKFQEEARTMLRMGVGMVAILGPAQLFFGDQHGLNTLEYQPVKVAAVGLFVISFVGLAISTLPYLAPPSITLWEAAASPKSQTFMLVGTTVLVPFVLGYTVFVYHTFRGKIRPGEGYH